MGVDEGGGREKTVRSSNNWGTDSRNIPYYSSSITDFQLYFQLKVGESINSREIRWRPLKA